MVKGEDDMRPWDLGGAVTKPVPGAEPVPRLLYFGMEGEDVKELQRKLGLTPNGYFGYGTAEEVVKIQSLHNLAAHGIVGAGTWKFINDLKVEK
jgi:peptidoglycan hydrolase-like protein with peptidoglycan-binding domain